MSKESRDSIKVLVDGELQVFVSNFANGWLMKLVLSQVLKLCLFGE